MDACVYVTYSVCEHFYPNGLLLWSLHVEMVKTQIYKPVGHTHTYRHTIFGVFSTSDMMKVDSKFIVDQHKTCTHIHLSVFECRYMPKSFKRKQTIEESIC